MSQLTPFSAARRRPSFVAFIVVLAVLGALLSVLGQASSARADGGTASVSGMVTDASTSSPVAGVSVYVNSQDGSYFDATITAADGTYSLTAIPAGSYSLQFQPGDGSNYVLQCWQGDSCIDGNQTFFPLADDQVATGFDVALAPGAEVAGTVTDSSGNPLSNVNVFADSTNAGGGSVTTGDSGTYDIAGLPAGAYTVHFQPFAGNFLEQWWNDQATAATANSVTLTAGSTASGIDAHLAAGATISGTVASAAGPVEGATVQAFDPSNPLLNEEPGVTAADGSYTIGALPSGTYKVEFAAPEGQNFAT